jgi:hypothetical protein
MALDLTVPSHFTTQFDKNWKELAQQKVSRLRSRVQVEDGCTGEARTHNQVGLVKSERVTGERFKKIVLQDLPTAKRWVRPDQYQTPTGESKWDERGLLPTISPSGKHTMAHFGAFARDVDQCIIDALNGTAYAGDKGADAVVLPDTSIIASNYVHTGSGGTATSLTVDKIIGALRILSESEAFNDELAASGVTLHGVFNARMEESLRLEASKESGSRLFSSDFLPPVLNERGQIKSFLGIDWTRSELVTKDAEVADTWYANIWVSDGVQFDVWEDMKTTIDRRPDLSNAVQFLSQYSMGATRLEEKKVIRIACKL